MAGLMPVDEYDLAGFAVGIVDKEKMFDKSTIKSGDVIKATGHKWDEGKVFKCWFKHPADGSVGSYAYAMIPQANAKEIKKFADKAGKEGKNTPVKVIRNDALCQAVMHGKTLCAVFHRSGEYVLEGKRFIAEYPSIVISGAENSEVRLPDMSR